MQLLIDSSDIANAPVEVRRWLAGALDLGPVGSIPGLEAEPKPSLESGSELASEPTSTEATPKATKKVKTYKPDASHAPDAPPAPDIKHVLEKALELIESKGEDVLAEILQHLDIRRVKECPEDKRAALLAEIAIHA